MNDVIYQQLSAYISQGDRGALHNFVKNSHQMRSTKPQVLFTTIALLHTHTHTHTHSLGHASLYQTYMRNSVYFLTTKWTTISVMCVCATVCLSPHTHIYSLKCCSCFLNSLVKCKLIQLSMFCDKIIKLYVYIDVITCQFVHIWFMRQFSV
jgi:hypothetical protein